MAVKKTAISKNKEEADRKLSFFRFGENLKGKFTTLNLSNWVTQLNTFNPAQLTKPTNENLRQKTENWKRRKFTLLSLGNANPYLRSRKL
jgi:hypothetical protein